MALIEEMESSGAWLFRWRSYLPLFALIVMIVLMKDFHYPYNDHHFDLIWELFCLSISFIGLGIRAVTIGQTPRRTSGRNTKRQVAESLNTTGIYSLVRHPLYLGNFLIWFGVSMFVRLWWFNIIIALAFWIYYERIMIAEEKFLRDKFRDEYTEWSKKIPAFIPNFRRWKPSSTRFSFKRVLKMEYSSFFATITSFFFLEVLGDYFTSNTIEIDRYWLIIFVFNLFIYITLRTLKKMKLLRSSANPS
ncbi:hypothetical protein MNBD_DELTA01-954 [hydrothermal vent metagenome]|uniref:Uncharacterized protein n=1 Tax=hydrothermal vent metagenome TaxID=652676 RepID=A0A3B0QQJ7_9ZZZZ